MVYVRPHRIGCSYAAVWTSLERRYCNSLQQQELLVLVLVAA